MSLPAQIRCPDGPDRFTQPNNAPEGRTDDTLLIDPEVDPSFEFLNQGGVLSAMARIVMNSVGANGLCVAYAQGGSVVCGASCGDIAPAVGTPLNLNSGIGARCLRECKTVTCNDTETDSRVNKDVCRRIGVRSMFAVPLRLDSEIIGIAQAFYAQPNAFSEANVIELEQSAHLFVSILPASANLEGSERISQASQEPTSVDATSCSGEESAASARVDAEIVEPDPRFDNTHSSSDEAPDQVSHSEPQPISDAAALHMQPFTDSLSMRQSSEQPVRGDVAEESHPVDEAPLNLADQIALTPFAQIEEPIWWKRPTLAAVAIAGVCVLLWVVSHPLSQISLYIPPTEKAAVENSDLSNNTRLTYVQLLKQAQSGNTGAQFALAKRFETGAGVRKSLTKAYSWYIIAGEGGDDAGRLAIRPLTSKMSGAQIASVRYDVARIYAKGVPTPDYVSAYAWMILAEAAGDPRAKAEQKVLAASMRPEQIVAAQRRASSWLKARGYSLQAQASPPVQR